MNSRLPAFIISVWFSLPLLNTQQAAEPGGPGAAQVQGLPAAESAPARLLAAGFLAEKEQRWEDAVACFQVYLALDGTSTVSGKVREELENIRWRVQYLSSPEGMQLLVQQKDEEDLKGMLALGLTEDATQKALDMIGKRPNHWRNYFLAASAFEKAGNYTAARSALEMGVPVMDKTQREHAGKMHAHITNTENQSVAVRNAAELLKKSKPAEAAAVYKKLVTDHPTKPLYRQLAIQSLILAEHYTEALSLINDPAIPEGMAMSKAVQDKLVVDITALKKQCQALQQDQKGTSGKSNQGASVTKPAAPPSMSKDFLNRVRK